MKTRYFLTMLFLFLILILLVFLVFNFLYKTDKDNVDKKNEEMPVINNTLVLDKTYDIEIRNMIRKFEFQKANKYVSEITNEAIKNDLPIMCSFETLAYYEQYNELRNLIKNLKDIENFFVSAMWLSSEERKYLIEDLDSLNPEFYGEISIIKNIDNEIEFKIEGNKLICYIKQKEDGGFYINNIKAIEMKDGYNYFTLREWESLKGGFMIE